MKIHYVKRYKSDKPQFCSLTACNKKSPEQLMRGTATTWILAVTCPACRKAIKNNKRG